MKARLLVAEAQFEGGANNTLHRGVKGRDLTWSPKDLPKIWLPFDEANEEPFKLGRLRFWHSFCR